MIHQPTVYLRVRHFAVPAAVVRIPSCYTFFGVVRIVSHTKFVLNEITASLKSLIVSEKVLYNTPVPPRAFHCSMLRDLSSMSM